MKKKFLITFAIAIIIISVTTPYAAMTDQFTSGDPKTLTIATLDSRSLSVERLLFTAFRDLSIHTMFKPSSSLNLGCRLADNGERDGVISSSPDMPLLYPNLRKVPIVLENIKITAYSKNPDLKILSWADLSDLNVGTLTYGSYTSNIPDDSRRIIRETNSALFAGLQNDDFDVIIIEKREHDESVNVPGVFISGYLDSIDEFLYLHKSLNYLIPSITDALQNTFLDGRAELILNDLHIPDFDSKRTVLHIISTNTEIHREDRLAARLRERFDNDMSIDWYSFALNSRRFSADASRITTIAQLLRQDLVNRDVAAIIVSGEEAMNFIREYYSLFFRNIPIVYYGTESGILNIHEDIELYGITEKVAAYETVELALKLFPRTRKIFVINDFNAEGISYKEMISDQLLPFSNRVSVEYNNNVSRENLMARIKTLEEDSIVLLGSYFTDSNAQYYSQNDMHRTLEQNCSVPLFSLYSSGSGYGAIGGKYPDYSLYADVIAARLRLILDDADSSNLVNITDSKQYERWFFDGDILKLWVIDPQNLPMDAHIYNITPSIWESDPMLGSALVAIVFLGIFISIGITVFVNLYSKQKTSLQIANELLLRDEKLREVKDRLERIINTAPLAFVLSIDGTTVEVNEYTKRNLGVNCGMKTGEYFGNLSLHESHYAEHDLENQVVELFMPSGLTHRFITTASCIEYEGQEGIITWAMDVEELERRKDEQQLAQNSLQTVLDALPVPITIFNINDRSLIYCNNASGELFGLDSIPNYYDKPILARFLPCNQPDGRTSDQHIHELANSDSAPAELICTRLDGSSFDALVTARKIDYRGVPALLGIIKDLTAEKEFARILRSTAEKEKEANILKSRFLVNMSHEIRTPMNAIIGLTEIELRKNIAPDTRTIYEKINSSAKNLLHIINDILDLSKIEADKVELHNEEFELEETVYSAMLVATPRLDDKNVESLINIAPGLPRFLIGDRTRLWQILKNFLDNSAKYTQTGRIVTTVFENNALSDSNTAYITFVIEDTGIGIPDDKLRMLFVPYFQVYNDAQKRYEGSGLGMAISKRLCQLMGGELNVSSVEGHGTGVFITIPFQRSQNTETIQEAEGSNALQGTRILAVDNDELSLGILQIILESSGASFESASSGEEALDLIISNGQEYDVIMLDYMMNGISGLDTAKLIRGRLSGARRFLMASVSEKVHIDEDLYACGIHELTEKPVIPTRLIRQIRRSVTHADSNTAKDDGYGLSEIYPGVRVLLCEDYLLNQEVAAGMFEQFGVETIVAENGKDGLDMLLSGETFDLIFMDLQMPVMDGYEATRQIRKDSRFDNIPIISLTADAMKEVAEKCADAGMDDYMAKPIEFEQVSKMFRKWLKRSHGTHEETQQIEEDPDPIEEAIRRFGGNRELYRKAHREFCASLPETWPEFEIITEFDELLTETRRIKNAAGNLSEKEIYQSATLFESSLKAETPDKIFYNRLADACREFKAASAEIEPEEDVKENWQLPDLNQMLDVLTEALTEYDPRQTSAALKILKQKIFPQGYEERLSDICTAAAKYEFDRANELLNSMRKEQS